MPPEVDALATELGVPAVERNPFRSIVIRALEVLLAVIEAEAIVAAYREPDPASVPVVPAAGVGWGATEAPRGMLVHRYETDAAGTILDARIIPPTSQNQPAIEADVRRVVEDHLARHRLDDPPEADHELQHRCEMAVRNHDPCISCATHFLTVDVRDANSLGSERKAAVTDRPAGRIVVIGVGHRDRADDGIGPAVVDALAHRTDEVVTLVREGDLAVLPAAVGARRRRRDRRCDRRPAARPVTSVRSIPQQLRSRFGVSTHGLDVVDAIELARRLQCMPARLRVFGITAGDFGYGPMSRELHHRVDQLADELLTSSGVEPD